jgi:hypothetical protein
MLPDMVQHRHPALGREAADRLEQRIVGPAAGGQLDADHPRVEAAGDLGQRRSGVVGIDRDVGAHPPGLLPLEAEQEVVAVAQVLGRGEVGRRGVAPTAQDGGHVHGNADAIARAQPAGVALPPVGARGSIVQEMRMDVDEHSRYLVSSLRSATYSSRPGGV